MTTIVDTGTALVTSYSGLVLAGLSAFAVAIRWAMTHTHSQRLLEVEKKAAELDTKLAGITATVQAKAPDVIKQVGPAVEIVDPKVDAQVAVYNKQIAELQAGIKDITDKINKIATVIPKS